MKETVRPQDNVAGKRTNLKARRCSAIFCWLRCIAVLQQFTGVNVMNYYAPLVLQNSSTEVVSSRPFYRGMYRGGQFYRYILFDRCGRIPIMKIGTIGSSAC